MSDRTVMIVATILQRRGINPDRDEIDREIRQQCRRGGEPAWRTDARHRRDDALRALDDLLPTTSQSLHTRARRLLVFVSRHSGAQSWSEEGRLLTAIRDCGLDVPKLSRLKTILRSRT